MYQLKHLWRGLDGVLWSDPKKCKRFQNTAIDWNKLDFFTTHKFYRAYLYYNPYTVKKTVALPVNGSSDIFNVLTGKYIARNASKEISFDIGPDDVVSLVIAPAKSKLR
jgi:hypothetical protein